MSNQAKSCVRKHLQLHQNAKINQDTEGTSEAIPKNWTTKLEIKFGESEKKMNSQENKLQLNESDQSS